LSKNAVVGSQLPRGRGAGAKGQGVWTVQPGLGSFGAIDGSRMRLWAHPVLRRRDSDETAQARRTAKVPGSTGHNMLPTRWVAYAHFGGTLVRIPPSYSVELV